MCELIDTVYFGSLDSNGVDKVGSVGVIITNGTIFDVISISFTIYFSFVYGHPAKCVSRC